MCGRRRDSGGLDRFFRRRRRGENSAPPCRECQQQPSPQLLPQLLQLQPHPQQLLQQPQLQQLLPQPLPPQEPPQQQHRRTRIMMIHRQEQSLFPLLKHISDTSL